MLELEVQEYYRALAALEQVKINTLFARAVLERPFPERSLRTAGKSVSRMDEEARGEWMRRGAFGRFFFYCQKKIKC